MSSGLRIIATGGIWGVGVEPKVGYNDGITDSTPVGAA